jgi:hypothetical protein
MTRRITNQDKLAMHKAICLATSVQHDLPAAYHLKPVVDCIRDAMPDFDIEDQALMAFLKISKLDLLKINTVKAVIARSVAKNTFSQDTSWVPAVYQEEIKLLLKISEKDCGLRHLDKFLDHIGYKPLSSSLRIIQSITTKTESITAEGAPKFSAGLSFTVEFKENTIKHTFKSRYSLNSLDQLLDEVQMILYRKMKAIRNFDDSVQPDISSICNNIIVYMNNKTILTFKINTTGVSLFRENLNLKDQLSSVDINENDKQFVRMLSDYSIFEECIDQGFRRQLKNCMLENALGM